MQLIYTPVDDMKKQNPLISGLLILSIIISIFASGCIDSTPPKKYVCSDGSVVDSLSKCPKIEEYTEWENTKDRVNNLITSTARNLQKIDLTSGNIKYTEIELKVNEARSDIGLAISILEKAKIEYPKKEKEIKSLLVKVNYLSYFADFLEGFYIDGMGHLDKGFRYVKYSEYNKAKIEILEAEKGISKSQTSIASMKEILNEIENDPQSDKTILNEEFFEKADELLSDFKTLVSGLIGMVNGAEYVEYANEYIDTKDWEKAEKSYRNAKIEFSKSKEIFAKLKDSDNVEISIVAIDMYALTKSIEEVSSHMEMGLKYAKEGDTTKAYLEFNKAKDILS